MNVLRKFKLVFIAVLAFLFTLTVTSCKKEEEGPVLDYDTEEHELTGIADDDSSFTTAKANVSESGFNFDTAQLSSINIDVSNAKTTFFLGEDFSSEGVVVQANFLATINGERKSESYNTTDFTVDSSHVDMFNIGTYPVEVTYRYKATVNKKSYNVNVISSEIANSGEEYVGGIDVKYKDNAEYSLDLNQEFDANVLNFSVIQHFFKKNVETKNAKTIPSSKYSTDGSKPVKIDASAVNTKVRGDYFVKVTYTPDSVWVDDKELTYSVTAFIMIHVLDPITGLKFVSGTQEFFASASDFDYSDWSFELTRKISGKGIVKYNETDFRVQGVVSFIKGKQTATVSYMDYAVDIEVAINVKESETYNITTGNIYNMADDPDNPGTLICKDGIWKSGLGTSTENTALDDSGVFKINKPSGYEDRYDTKKKLSKDKYGALYFGYRVKIAKTDSYVAVTMDNPGLLVIYAASPQDESRDVCVYSEPNLGGTEVGTIYTSAVKQQISQIVFEVKEAGTYYIQSFEGGIYLHGIVVAVAK